MHSHARPFEPNKQDAMASCSQSTTAIAITQFNVPVNIWLHSVLLLPIFSTARKCSKWIPAIEVAEAAASPSEIAAPPNIYYGLLVVEGKTAASALVLIHYATYIGNGNEVWVLSSQSYKRSPRWLALRVPPREVSSHNLRCCLRSSAGPEVGGSEAHRPHWARKIHVMWIFVKYR